MDRFEAEKMLANATPPEGTSFTTRIPRVLLEAFDEKVGPTAKGQLVRDQIVCDMIRDFVDAWDA